jgi:hypothetical protein
LFEVPCESGWHLTFADGLVRLTAIAGYVNPDNAGHRDKHRGRESCEELTTSTGHGVSLRQVVAA